MTAESINYDQAARAYARGRAARQLVVEELERGGRSGGRMLEIGCGTGNYIKALAGPGTTRSAVDPSMEMLRFAGSDRSIAFVTAEAESLPFEDGTFDFVFSVDVAHHLRSTSSYFDEAFRVLKPNGFLCTATDSEQNIRRRRPLAEYWPGTIAVDIKRYPSISLLRKQMTEAGFVGIEEHNIEQAFELTDAGPYRDKAFSCLQLISEKEFAGGLGRLEADLRIGPIQGLSLYLCLWGRKP